MDYISWQYFEKVEIRVGTVIEVVDFPEAKKPAFKLKIDFGPDIGIRESSAQITVHYTKEALLHTQVVCVINFTPKKIGPFVSQVLITGFPDNNSAVVLCVPQKQVPNGAKLY
ncbi:tRNA-binding protein [Candidatus Dependentiae bacterium]|nr:MAG: tRNA-binding protein [Candidatus Dependentiae bacterium]